MWPSVPQDPALLHTDLAPWLLYFLWPEHPLLLLAPVLTSAEAGGSAAGPYSWQVACAKVTCGKDALRFLFSGCPDARELGCVLLQAAGTADITAL